ncbi:MAG TPA: hypothetical protein DCE78_12625 [Bacteroidetes bacterium]|nr:hypothetical protein [Bacteroidota bacterium]
MDIIKSANDPNRPVFSNLDVTPVVSIQGQPGSFHHIGARRLFGEVEFLYRDSFREVFADARSGRANFLFVAIENSIAGSIIYNYDLLANHRIPIVAEKYLRIGQHLIAKPGTQLASIKEVWSHPMAIEQCRDFLETLDVRVVEKDDTAGSVRDLRDHSRNDIAVISSDYSAELYGMQIIRPHIETDPNNYTRFLLLSHVSIAQKQGVDSNQSASTSTQPESNPPTGSLHHPPRPVSSPLSGSPHHPTKGKIKSTLWFGVSHKPGGLVDLLHVFREFNVNMTKIESRPRVGSPWVYDFFADVHLDANTESGKQILASAREHCEFLHVLGSYPDVSVADPV